MAPTGTNPFDDEEDNLEIRVNPAPTNPFEDDEDDTNPAGGFAGVAAEETSDDLPVEASWQYLGDLPYRRVPIYSNVGWNEASENDMDEGLAAFPTSYIKAQMQSNVLDSRDIRELLSTTTITKVAGCPHGGPVAAVTLPVLGGSMKTTDLRVMTNSGRLLTTIELPPKEIARKYSAADVMTIGFTERTSLIVVLRDSMCLTYDLSGNPLLPPFQILPGDVQSDLLQAAIYEGGVAVLSTKMKSAIVEILDEHDDPSYANSAHMSARRIVKVTNSVADRAEGEMFGGGEQQPPHYALVTPLETDTFAHKNLFNFASIAVLPRFHTSSRHPEVFLSTSDNSVVVIDIVSMEMTDVDCRERIKSPIVLMSFAPNGRFLACFTQASILTVISTSFETKVLDFDTSEGSQAPPQDMKWCGEDSVVLHWKKLGVLMVGPYGDWLRFPYENIENLYIVPEIDCCRVITDNSVEILQRVPPATAALLRIGSIEPSAMLLDAADAFESGSASSDEDARAITKTGMLNEAIETCTDAATREFDISMQKRLLRAASFGLHFSYKDPENTFVMGGPVVGNDGERSMPSDAAIKFTAAARKLRTLNALRDPAVGFILTASQFDHVTATGVIARLVEMKRPALAASIGKYMVLPKNVQLFARASKAAAFVTSTTHLSDAETAKAAIRIINGDSDDAELNTANKANGGGYATVALAAGKAGRPGVSNLLLMLESSVAEKVPALISTGAFADAMAVATSARDADFIFFTLMEYEKSCVASGDDVSSRQSTFLASVISKFTPEGFNTLRRYLETAPESTGLMNLFLKSQRSVDAGSLIAKKAMEAKEDPAEASRLLGDASRLFSLGKETAFYKAITDDQIELLKDQEFLRSKYATDEVAPHSSSVSDTISALIKCAGINKRESHRLLADVEKLAKKFRLPEKRLWHLKVKAFAESGQWPQLRTLADSKNKSPIGFKPFALATIKYNQSMSEIMRYIDRVQGSEERYELFWEAKFWKRAVEEAVKMKDPTRIANVRSICNSADIQQVCDEMMSRI